MAENEMQNQNVESGEENNPSGVDYIEAIKKLQQNTVSKNDYAKLQEENKKLLESLVNGETIAQQTETSVDMSALRKELYTTEFQGSDLDYITKTLELREAVIDAGGMDPFLPYGKKIMPTDEDIDTANRVADILKECVEYAEGDNAVFVNELQRRMIDTAPVVKGKRK